MDQNQEAGSPRESAIEITGQEQARSEAAQAAMSAAAATPALDTWEKREQERAGALKQEFNNASTGYAPEKERAGEAERWDDPALDHKRKDVTSREAMAEATVNLRSDFNQEASLFHKEERPTPERDNAQENELTLKRETGLSLGR